MFRKELRTEIEIHAPAERIWDILVDFAGYPEWNPVFRFGPDSSPEAGRIKVTIHQPNGRRYSFEPEVLRFEPERELRWRGRFLLPGLLTGEHVFSLERSAGGATVFSHWEIFTGLLVPLLGHDLDTNTRKAFESYNRALKRRAERETNNEE